MQHCKVVKLVNGLGLYLWWGADAGGVARVQSDRLDTVIHFQMHWDF